MVSFMEKMVYYNPYLNPVGFAIHLCDDLSGREFKINDFDNPLLRFQSNTEDTHSSFPEKIPSGLTREERIQYFRDKGGTGLVYDNKPKSLLERLF